MNYQNPQQFQPQAMQLPFNPQQLNSQPNQFRPDNPPCLPNVGNVPQMFQHLIVPIAAQCANVISSNAMKHSGRVFLYNQTSSNGYNNPDFANIVYTAVDLLIWGMTNRAYSSPEHGVADAVEKAVSACTALNFQKFPQLAQYVPPEVYNDAMQSVSKLGAIAGQIQQIKASMQQSIPMQNPMMMNNSYQTRQMPNQMPQQNWRSNQQPGSQYENVAPVYSDGSIFNNTGNTFTETQAVTKGFDQTSRYNYIKKVEPQLNINQNAYFNKSVVKQAEPEVKKELVWLASPLQLHPVTIDERTQKIGLKEKLSESDGKTYVISFPINLSEQEIMDRSKHQINAVSNAFTNAVPGDYPNREVALQDTVDQMSLRTREVQDIEQNVGTEAVKEEGIKIAGYHSPMGDNFLSSAIFSGRMAMMRALSDEDKDCQAYRVMSLIGTPVIVEIDQTDLIDKLLEAKTYQKICHVLKTGLESPESVKLISVIDKLFTNQVNSIIVNQMSLSDLKIDSFIEDAIPLIAHLGEHVGTNYRKAYLDCQETFTKDLINNGMFDNDMIDSFDENLDIAAQELTVNYLTQYYSMTYLEVHSSELGIKTVEGVAGAVLESINPLLYKLAFDIFEQFDGKEHKPSHYLLITSDDIIYEFYKGLIGNKFFTIRKHS